MIGVDTPSQHPDLNTRWERVVMAEHESHAPQEATAQVVAAGARHSSEYHSFERHGFEDSVEQRHRKILVFAHVGRKEARDAARQA